MFKFFTIIFCCSFLFLPLQLETAMSSTNYNIYSDVISMGGGGSASGGDYEVFETFGESMAGSTSSTTYIVRSGFMSSDQGVLTMSISNSSLSLGDLSTSAVSSGNSTVTITTDSVTGYSLTIGSVSGSSITAVSDGEVTAGSKEYGFTASGDNTSISNDVAVLADQAIAVSSGEVIDDEIILTFKASDDGTAESGSYSQTVTLSASANL